MKQYKPPLLIFCLAFVLFVGVVGALAAAQDGDVLAEAIQQANVRSGPGTEYDITGSILAGRQYPVIGRHDIFPWVLISFGDPPQPGWVYIDLVKLTGDINAVPFVPADYIPQQQPGQPAPAVTSPTPAATKPPADAAPADLIADDPTAPPATETPPPLTGETGVTASALNYANLRCGPGTENPQVGTIYEGEAYPVLQRHITLPWVQIAYPDYITGVAWVYVDLVAFQGDINTVPGVQNVSVDCPLTPTPPAVVAAESPWGAFPGEPGAASSVSV